MGLTAIAEHAVAATSSRSEPKMSFRLEKFARTTWVDLTLKICTWQKQAPQGRLSIDAWEQDSSGSSRLGISLTSAAQ